MILKSTALPGDYYRVVYIDNDKMSFELTIKTKTEMDAIQGMMDYIKRFLL